ncbi:hypothetical protein HAX54_049598, partial [Datura stramonium]|nr:hypothetical protein [Datura stramonium]
TICSSRTRPYFAMVTSDLDPTISNAIILFANTKSNPDATQLSSLWEREALASDHNEYPKLLFANAT